MCTGPHDFIPAENTIRARLVFSQPGGLAMNVLHYQGDGPVTEVGLNALGQHLVEWWIAEGAAMSVNGVSLEYIELTDVSVEDGIQITYTTDLPVPGGANVPVLPGNVTLAIKELSALGGRSNRGRIFMVGIISTGIAGDTISAGYQSDIQAAYEELFGATFSDDGFHLAVVSYCHNGDWRTTATVNQVVSMTVDRTTDSQRRRLSGRGV